MLKWWERFWAALWFAGSALVAYLTAQWWAEHAMPSNLGYQRYGLLVFAGLLGWLVGALLFSIAIVLLMTVLEFILARFGLRLRPPAPPPAEAEAATEAAASPLPPAEQS